MDLIRELSCQKEELACETKMLGDRCSSLQTELKESIKAREAIESDANNAKRCLFYVFAGFFKGNCLFLGKSRFISIMIT